MCGCVCVYLCLCVCMCVCVYVYVSAKNENNKTKGKKQNIKKQEHLSQNLPKHEQRAKRIGNSMGIQNPILYFPSNDSLDPKSPISFLLTDFDNFFFFDLEIPWGFQIRYCTLPQIPP